MQRGPILKRGRKPDALGERRKLRCFAAWNQMIQRCGNPSNPRWKDYGGRGITVCAAWRKFPAFYADMGECPPGLQLERLDNDGNYEPGNCVWATRKQQMCNRRNSRREPPPPKMSKAEAGRLGVKVSAERRAAASDAAIARIEARWKDPDNTEDAADLVRETGLTRNTVVARLGPRTKAQIAEAKRRGRRKGNT